MKHKFFAFHNVILHTNRGQFLALMAPTRRQDFESKFSKMFHGRYSRPNLRERVPHSAPIASTTFYCAQDSSPPVLGPRPSCPWCPTCAPVRTTSWCRHCLKQDRHGPRPLHIYLPSLSSTLPSCPSPLFPSPSFLLEVGSFNPSPSPSPISVVRGFSLPENLFKPRWMQVKIDTFWAKYDDST